MSRLGDRFLNSLAYRTGVRLPKRFPKTKEELEASDVFRQWWYYSAELLPGVTARGFYPEGLPLLPRVMLRECDLRGADCLDLGSMEGLLPVLMKRKGARRVLATDAVPHCAEKMEAVRHYYGESFEFEAVGLMYDLHKKIPGSFDLVNCSGLLYHVVSPLMVLFGARPLVKRGGLMIVSTNLVLSEGASAEFNAAGRMQVEANTFWYPTVRLMDYWLRFLKLAPLRCLYTPHEAVQRPERKYVFGTRSGYVSVLCRAVGEVLPEEGDDWMSAAARESWEFEGLSDWKRAAEAPESVVPEVEPDARFLRGSLGCIDLCAAVAGSEPVTRARDESESHTLRLSHVS
jgi:2-polyprenyl-3-methyl-5-hydroxy-6-metoxy-1,4-benzoquinol methylase